MGTVGRTRQRSRDETREPRELDRMVSTHATSVEGATGQFFDDFRGRKPRAVGNNKSALLARPHQQAIDDRSRFRRLLSPMHASSPLLLPTGKSRAWNLRSRQVSWFQELSYATRAWPRFRRQEFS